MEAFKTRYDLQFQISKRKLEDKLANRETLIEKARKKFLREEQKARNKPHYPLTPISVFRRSLNPEASVRYFYYLVYFFRLVLGSHLRLIILSYIFIFFYNFIKQIT